MKHHDDFDQFDPIEDDYDELDGFHIVGVDTEDDWCYSDAPPICLFGIGDNEERCIKYRYGCHVEGCDYATPND